MLKRRDKRGEWELNGTKKRGAPVKRRPVGWMDGLASYTLKPSLGVMQSLGLIGNVAVDLLKRVHVTAPREEPIVYSRIVALVVAFGLAFGEMAVCNVNVINHIKTFVFCAIKALINW